MKKKRNRCANWQRVGTDRPTPILHARIVARSWDGERVEAIAQELHCNPQTVRRRLHRFDMEGIDGLGDRAKPGRPRRLTTADDSQLIALVSQPPLDGW
jgi:transposase